MFCPHCGKELAFQPNFCSACGSPASPMHSQRARPIVRPRAPRMIAGVCAGFAMHFGWDLGLTRILFVLFTVLTSGLGLLVYLAAWIILPEGLYALPSSVSYGTPTSNVTQSPTV